jgi:hypothetical protein
LGLHGVTLRRGGHGRQSGTEGSFQP